MVERTALRAVPLFQHLSARGLERVGAAAAWERLPKGAVLFKQGERAASMWVVIEGWVHLVRSPHRDNGRHAIVMFTVTPEEALCGISAIDEQTYQLSAVAGTDCRVVRLSSELFQSLLRGEPHFAYDALRLYGRRIRNIAQQYGAMAEPVSNRIVRAILRLEQQFGSQIPVTHRELAQMSWTTTESAIRAVRRLKRQGVVDGRRGQLHVEKPVALTKWLESTRNHTAASA